MPQLLNKTVTVAQAGQVGSTFQIEPGPNRDLLLEAIFTYGSGGTSVDGWVQTSLDGVNWSDIANFHFLTTTARKIFNLSSATPVTTQATPTDGSLAANTAVDGIIGGFLRVKYTTVGTYAANTSLVINAAGQRIRT